MHVDPVVFLAHVLRVASEYHNWDEAERMLRHGITDSELLDTALWTLTEMRTDISHTATLQLAA